MWLRGQVIYVPCRLVAAVLAPGNAYMCGVLPPNFSSLNRSDPDIIAIGNRYYLGDDIAARPRMLLPFTSCEGTISYLLFCIIIFRRQLVSCWQLPFSMEDHLHRS